MRPMLFAALSFCIAAMAGCGRGPEEDAVASAAPVRTTSGSAATPGDITVAVDSPQAQQIKVQAVTSHPVAVDEVIAPGRVTADPHGSARVLLPVPGRIAGVYVRLGDVVTRGQPLVDVESAEADAAQAAARQAAAAQHQAQASLTKAQTDLERLRDLLQVGAVPQKEVVAAQNDMAQAEAALETARAGAAQAHARLRLLGVRPDDARPLVPVRAPIGGKVIDLVVAPGENRSDTAAPLLTIADLGRVWVTAQVPETRIRYVRVGDPVDITLVAYPDQRFTGRIARIADVFDAETRTLKVHIELPNPDGRLRPDMFATVRHPGPTRSLPVVPSDAVVQQYGKTFVFRERQPGRFERREVTLGPRTAESVAVLTGVTLGDRVVVTGALLLAAE